MARIKGKIAGETRGQILRAAQALFADRGFSGTSLRDIADELSLSKSAVYYHFSSKDALLAEILRPMAHEMDVLRADLRAAQDQIDAAAPGAVDDLRRTVLDSYIRAQLVNVPLMRTMLSEPGVRKAALSQHGSDEAFAALFVDVFARAADEATRMRHRCALGAVTGSLIFTVSTMLCEDPHATATDLTEQLRPLAGVLLDAACAVLHC